MSLIVCPDCHKEYTCYGQMIFCPNCGYRFEVEKTEPTVIRVAKEKRQPIWNKEKQGFDF